MVTGAMLACPCFCSSIYPFYRLPFRVTADTGGWLFASEHFQCLGECILFVYLFMKLFIYTKQNNLEHKYYGLCADKCELHTSYLKNKSANVKYSDWTVT